MKNTTALILVDIQNDFIPGGALAVPDGDQVIPIANRLIPKFDLVVATQDWHPSNHQSFASQHQQKQIGDVVDLHGLTQILWPDHCTQGTSGADFCADLDTSQITRVFQKGTDETIDSYSGFFDNGKRKTTGLDEFLDKHEIQRVFVMGLATDYCVKFTALDAVECGFETWLIEDGCRGVNLNPGDVETAIQEMQLAGIHLTNSQTISN